jgi:hypothetical protein
VISKAGEGTPVRLVNSKWMAETYPETFQRHPIKQIPQIPEGLFVKVYCFWPLDDLTGERFWVEITDVKEIQSGPLQYFGELRNDTLVGEYGDCIGPITSKCICDVDIVKFHKEKKRDNGQ